MLLSKELTCSFFFRCSLGDIHQNIPRIYAAGYFNIGTLSWSRINPIVIQNYKSISNILLFSILDSISIQLISGKLTFFIFFHFNESEILSAKFIYK